MFYLIFTHNHYTKVDGATAGTQMGIVTTKIKPIKKSIFLVNG
jgi:hypothetical protein